MLAVCNSANRYRRCEYDAEQGQILFYRFRTKPVGVSIFSEREIQLFQAGCLKQTWKGRLTDGDFGFSHIDSYGARVENVGVRKLQLPAGTSTFPSRRYWT